MLTRSIRTHDLMLTMVYWTLAVVFGAGCAIGTNHQAPPPSTRPPVTANHLPTVSTDSDSDSGADADTDADADEDSNRATTGNVTLVNAEAAVTEIDLTDPRKTVQSTNVPADPSLAASSGNDEPVDNSNNSNNSGGEGDSENSGGEDASAQPPTPEQVPFDPGTTGSLCIDSNSLTLDEVLRSVTTSYPLLDVALAELAAADGEALAAWGSFDSVLSGYSISKPLGFYENYRHGAKLGRPLWNGGELYGGYRIGRGVYEPWYKERQTNEGGEFKTGFKQPLLKGYAIDQRRADVQTTELERQRLEPDIRTRVIGMQLAASQIYWKWVALGQVVRMQERLVQLARRRNENLIRQVEAGDLPTITEIDNGRFIAKRQVKLVESQRKLQEAAIKLSLFYRDDSGAPVIAADDRLPCDFPPPDYIDSAALESDIVTALAQRPELLELDLQRQQTEVKLGYARNQTMPKLDAFAEAKQDVGEATSSKKDKSQLELEVGVLAEVPLQRRAARGKIQAARSKLAQIASKRRYTEDKIRSQVQDAASALNYAYQRIEQSRENLRLTERSLQLGRVRFEEGDIDIIKLNIYETSLAEAELLLIDAEFAYFTALADYRAALAIDPTR